MCSHGPFVTGVYFSIYAVGMVGTAYGIYSLAFVRLLRTMPILAWLMDKRFLAVQADAKGLTTRIELDSHFSSMHRARFLA